MSTLNKILLTVAAVGGISAATIAGTYANFTATPTTISNNAVTSGSVTMSRSGSGAVFSASAMKIGDTSNGSITITNTGSLAAVYSLDGSLSGSSALGNQLTLKIYKDADNTGSPIYNGTLAGLGSISLGTFSASGDAHTYYFHVSLPTTGADAGDNAFQGLSATESLTWSATQA